MGIEEDEEEIWVKHYSSNQRILLVGEGDFSFSSTLARLFGSASNIVATSLDTYDMLIGKYKKAKRNLEILVRLGGYTLHGVDATKMKLHSDLKMQNFDRIIFNFPHAGFHGKENDIRLIERHKKLVLGFFKNASGMLQADGEIHVSHKTSFPFDRWNIEELAWKSCLRLTECVDFKIQDFPGYNNKRGHKKRCDEPFPLGECSTFKFRIFPAIKKMSRVDYAHIRSELSTCYSFETNYQPTNPSPVGNAYQSGMHTNRSSEICGRPIGINYGIPRFVYERSRDEEFGRCQQYQANPTGRYPFTMDFSGYTGSPLWIALRQGSLNNNDWDRYSSFGCSDVQRGFEVTKDDFAGYTRAPLSIANRRGSLGLDSDRYSRHASREATRRNVSTYDEYSGGTQMQRYERNGSYGDVAFGLRTWT